LQPGTDGDTVTSTPEDQRTSEPRTTDPQEVYVASETNQPAPETQTMADERNAIESDQRIWPGGAHGVPVDPGMSSLDRDAVPSGAGRTGEQGFGRSEDVKR
jgi:hypothetical protein